MDFFFDLPNQAACEQLSAVLKAREFEVDYRQVEADRGDRFTLHARKSMRISVPDMQAFTRDFGAGRRFLGRYDGWAAAGMTRELLRK